MGEVPFTVHGEILKEIRNNSNDQAAGISM